jgi:type I restriction enzyme M protein
MAVKKSELYSALWNSCNKLRGGMDASQYKDYVLVLLFMKYVSDRAKSGRNSLLEIPTGGGFSDLVALKGKKDIGDGINKVIAKLAEANDLQGVINVADFNDDSKLGKGLEMVDTLTELIAIFENPALDFSSNQADGDDLLGDAYEYLMRNFATESGKSKGQFYTPAEVSRIMARVIGLDKAQSQLETIYDPACGSGSLLLKAHDAAKSATGFDLAIYGQEKDNATAALSRMNMWLHDAGTAEIKNSNTLSTPEFTDPKTGKLRTFDYVVANPPFSVKDWTLGVNIANDPYSRFAYGTPPDKNGDYAFLLHILASMKSTGKGAVILPHGVLFRGNAEATIRRNLIKQGFIKGIIGLPANLFFGTGIPACLILLDKEGAAKRDSIFMINASRGFMKDGPKNRLRERDIHLIIDTFLGEVELEKFSRIVPVSEIADPKNDYNLNLTRYIDSSEPQDLQDLDAHLNGGIPASDIDLLSEYWHQFPKLRGQLLKAGDRPGYLEFAINPQDIHRVVSSAPEFEAFREAAIQTLRAWEDSVRPGLLELSATMKPKDLITNLSENLLSAFRELPIVDAYAIYQSLMKYWSEEMQDDAYLVIGSGWMDSARLKALPTKKKGEKRSGRVDFTLNKIDYRSELLPAGLIEMHFFGPESLAVRLALETAQAKIEELESEYGSEDMLLSDVSNESGSFTKKAVEAALKLYKQGDEEHTALLQVQAALDSETAAKKAAKVLEDKVRAQYGLITEAKAQELAVSAKWLTAIEVAVEEELSRIVSELTSALTRLHLRYSQTVATIATRAVELSQRVDSHLVKMGFSING